MKRINNLLNAAMTALQNSNPRIVNDKSMLKEYDGYAAAFAPSVITAGLRATLSFYTDVHKGENNDTPRRNHVLKVLYDIYQSMPGHLTGESLLDIALETNQSDERRLRQDLIDCSIALKLVMRNFKQLDAPPAAPAQPNA
ncbi:MAG: type III-B CRISPR module-associated protein Cmr5 [Saprospiraceae bacterium]